MYDDSFLKIHNQDKLVAEAKIRYALDVANIDFKDETLGTEIDVHLVGNIEHWAGITMDADKFSEWMDYLKQNNSSIPIKKATHVLFTNNNG